MTTKLDPNLVERLQGEDALQFLIAVVEEVSAHLDDEAPEDTLIPLGIAAGASGAGHLDRPLLEWARDRDHQQTRSAAILVTGIWRNARTGPSSSRSVELACQLASALQDDEEARFELALMLIEALASAPQGLDRARIEASIDELVALGFGDDDLNATVFQQLRRLRGKDRTK